MNAIDKKQSGKDDMAESGVATRLQEFVLQNFPLARKRQIQVTDALLESGIMDSQGVLEVVGFIEREFSIAVADDDLVPENFQTIHNISAYVNSKKRASTPLP
jgi:acyl carrier protein